LADAGAGSTCFNRLKTGVAPAFIDHPPLPDTAGTAVPYYAITAILWSSRPIVGTDLLAADSARWGDAAGGDCDFAMPGDTVPGI
jgi:hypothetical protein